MHFPAYPLQQIGLLATLILVAGAASGCGTTVPCAGTTVVNVFPATATADHMSAAPGDQQQFSATTGIKYPANATGCVYSALSQKLTPTWIASDSTNVRISSAQDATNGLATCVGADQISGDRDCSRHTHCGRNCTGPFDCDPDLQVGDRAWNLLNKYCFMLSFSEEICVCPWP